ncbi:hypothetical protein CWR43_04875 [Rhizobium sullae]|uniref:Uncharacterized protein n=1 Tax=Rhizobium sullae TaxID=50338 RepID=A0A2N0DG91_RHISU|nr:hypothetical protein CWR43_04875 [Rhizobium sullae]
MHVRPLAIDETPPEGTDLDWEVQAILAFHDDDAKAAIETLLLDCKYLRHQLALAESVLSRGITRGWSPKYEREV